MGSMFEVDYETTKLRTKVTPSEKCEAIFFREKSSEYFHEIRDLQPLAANEFVARMYLLDEHGPLFESQEVIVGPEPFKWDKTPPLFSAIREGDEIMKGQLITAGQIALGSLYVRLWDKG